MLLNKKTAIVTGSENGIGKAILDIFVRNGATVIGIDIKEESKNSYYKYYKLDVSETYECEIVYQSILKDNNRIDILVNCAGITRDAMTKNMTEEQFNDVINVNLKGVWNLTRLVGPKMQNDKGGSIINISSVVGVFGNIGQVNYAAAKAGIIGMTKTWAKEFALKGGNVRVNAVAPGYTLTDIIKTVPQSLLDKFASQTMLGRLAEPQEIANVVLFLASDLSSYITGEVINANGGMIL